MQKLQTKFILLEKAGKRINEMPFKSKAQQRYMFAKHPEIAKEFAEATPNIKRLPEHVGKKTTDKERQMKHHEEKHEHKKEHHKKEHHHEHKAHKEIHHHHAPTIWRNYYSLQRYAY